MSATTDGPLLDSLMRRLAECPPDFLAAPRSGRKGRIRVEAVVADLLDDLGALALSDEDARHFDANASTSNNTLSLVLVACWLLHDEWIVGQGRFAQKALAWLKDGLTELGLLVSAPLFTTDPDRREELARLCLEALDLRPAGESEAQAADRLNSLNSVQRERIIRETQAQLEHARQLKKAMAEQAAREAAARYSRE